LQSGKCAKCDKVMLHVIVEHIIIKTTNYNGPEFHGASFLCPNCKAVISVSYDPLTLKEDIASLVVQKLGR